MDEPLVPESMETVVEAGFAAEQVLEAFAAGDMTTVNVGLLQAHAESSPVYFYAVVAMAHFAIQDAAQMHGQKPDEYRANLAAWCRHVAAEVAAGDDA